MESEDILDGITRLLQEKFGKEEEPISFKEEQENRAREITNESIQSILRFSYDEQFTNKLLNADIKTLNKERKQAVRNLRGNIEMLDLPLTFDEIEAFEEMAAEDRHLIKIIDFLIAEKNG